LDIAWRARLRGLAIGPSSAVLKHKRHGLSVLAKTGAEPNVVHAAVHDQSPRLPLARILHKGLEQEGGRGVSELENTDAYANALRRPSPDRL